MQPMGTTIYPNLGYGPPLPEVAEISERTLRCEKSEPPRSNFLHQSLLGEREGSSTSSRRLSGRDETSECKKPSFDRGSLTH